MVNGKQKGSQFERDICIALSRFVDPDGDDTLFWRSAMSGGRATVQNNKGGKNKSQLGDITCVHKKGHWLTDIFVIECKHYAKLDIESFFLKGKGRLATFWLELRKICIKNDRLPMLIAKQNRTQTLLILNPKAYNNLRTLGFTNLHIIANAYHGPNSNQAVVCFFDSLSNLT